MVRSFALVVEGTRGGDVRDATLVESRVTSRPALSGLGYDEAPRGAPSWNDAASSEVRFVRFLVIPGEGSMARRVRARGET